MKLQKGLAHCGRSRAETFGIVAAGELRRVRLADISCVESDKHYLIFHVGKDELRARGSMRDIREQFLRNGFAAIRNSTLVNLAHVAGFAGGAVTVGGAVLPLARSSTAAFLQALAPRVGQG